MIRVLHVVTQPWEVTEGIARACTEMASALDGVESQIRTADPWYRFGSDVRTIDPDVVHLHGGTLAPAFAFAPSLHGRPVVATCYRGVELPRGAHRVRESTHNVSRVRRMISAAGGLALARHALRSSRCAVVCTPDPKIAGVFAMRGPVLRVDGGAHVSDRRAEWNDQPTVVFAGRAQAGRGIDDLVAAFPFVRAEVPHARLRLALLPTPDASRWVDALAPVPWADVTVGPVDIQELYASCHVGAFPFRWSATMTPALAAAEAMAVGLPIVASSVDCLRPLVEPGRNGALVPPSDVDALARALIDMVRAPEVWQPMAEGARKTIEERWSWRNAAEHTKDAYELAMRSTR
jgi:glycosyltransferase involved in cell wall biosynthesis